MEKYDKFLFVFHQVWGFLSLAFLAFAFYVGEIV